VVAVPPPLLQAAKINAAVPAKARSLLLSMLFLLLHWGIAVGDGQLVLSLPDQADSLALLREPSVEVVARFCSVTTRRAPASSSTM
jgi:hypothetical protein